MKKRVRKGQHERPLARLERTLLEFGGEVRNGFASIREEFVAVRQEVATDFGAVRKVMATEFAAVRQEIREGDAETRTQLMVLIESLRDDIRMIAGGHVELDRRVRRLEGRGT
jgi:hypothetical protein